MSAETQSRVGRHEPTSMSADTRPILHCHPADTSPPLGRYFTNTRPTLNSLGQLLLPPEFYLPCSTERGFQWPSSFFGLQLPQYSSLFSSYVFSLSSLLYMTLVTFRCSSIWGLLLLEACYLRGAKDDIKSWYDCALFLPHGGVFSVLDHVIFHNSSWHKQYLPCCRVRFIRVQNTEKRAREM